MEASLVDRLPELPRPSGIGERLRAERQRSGMTVREIARRVGVSPSLVSQIERGKVNPSVSTLWAMVTVLGLPMSELFSEPAPSPDAGAAVTARGDGSPVTTP